MLSLAAQQTFKSGFQEETSHGCRLKMAEITVRKGNQQRLRSECRGIESKCREKFFLIHSHPPFLERDAASDYCNYRREVQDTTSIRQESISQVSISQASVGKVNKRDVNWSSSKGMRRFVK